MEEKRSWDPFKTFNVSEAERDLIDRRRKTRDKFRAEYRKLYSDPRTTSVVSSNFLTIFHFLTDAFLFCV
jgi:hypothetical protein